MGLNYFSWGEGFRGCILCSSTGDQAASCALPGGGRQRFSVKNNGSFIGDNAMNLRHLRPDSRQTFTVIFIKFDLFQNLDTACVKRQAGAGDL